ncbi:hypothetical protein BKA82DRAFT_16270 [Pisolithus tinctorius]|uniref:Uncharacterized protein n=1 Tax=Pisolithus tinctorius Marx 270 TaxID=870435 RepID=A0A0C3NJ93_PISTI|nr:hypothetical protein BKA82DRAFT_16270 [Pisolithus tinctorius]KIO01060.1 hypothetical protein M404DRAFT_16270 [Pisolithus tinctorius Marx 270]
MADRLPPELWSHIFDLAADEDVIFYPGLPTSMAQSTWARAIYGDWKVRTPQDTINIIQRRSYATKKAIIRTCKRWRQLGTEFLVRCLFFDNPTKLRDLRRILDRDTSLGWWVRRLHITHFFNGRGPTMDDFEEPLLAILAQTPNLEIFIVDWPMSTAFGAVADTLGAYCHNLRTAHWHVPSELVSKVIWALASLPSLISVHLTFDEAIKEPDTITLGSAESVKLTLPSLQQLFLKGFCQEFMEQAAGWTLPMFNTFSFDFGANTHDIPDVTGFLAQHGATLLFLDLNCVPALDIRAILDLCPILTTFCFNLDWKIPPPERFPSLNHDDSNNDPNADLDADLAPISLTNRPHEHIRHIGLHGCIYAFGVGYASAYISADPLRTLLVQRTNDANFRALSHASFPRLERVRILNPLLLQDLNDENGPRAGECFERWERWWDACESMRVRLEDCSGGLLGNLPRDPVEEPDGSDEEEEGEYEDYTDHEEERTSARVSNVAELRELLEECRRMSAEADQQPSFFFPL